MKIMNEIKKPVQARIVFTYEQDFQNFLAEFKVKPEDYENSTGKSSSIFVNFKKISNRQIGVAITRYKAFAQPM